MPDASSLTGGFYLGQRVRTIKGDRLKGPSGGTIVGWGMWRGWPTAKVRKADGVVRPFLIKNLVEWD